MPLGLGVLHGGAYKHPFYEEAKLKMEAQRQNMIERKMATEEMQQLASDLEVGKATNPYYQQQLNQFAEGRYKEIGMFMAKNPDYKVNPEKFMKYLSMTNELRDNQYTQASLDLDKQAQLLNDFVAKNPDSMKQKAVRDQFLAMKNQRLTGSADGQEDGNVPYTFEAVPEWKDFSKIAAEQSARITRRDLIKTDIGYQEDLYEEDYITSIQTLYMNHKEQVDEESAELGMEPEEYIGKLLKMGANLKTMPFSESELRARQGGGGSQSGDYSPLNFDSDFAGENGSVDSDLAGKMVGPTGRVHIIDPASEADDFNSLALLGGELNRRITPTGKWYRSKDTDGTDIVIWETRTRMSVDEAQDAGIYEEGGLFNWSPEPTDSRYVRNAGKGDKSRGEDDEKEYVEITGYVKRGFNDPYAKRAYQIGTASKEDKAPLEADQTVSKEYKHEQTGRVIEEIIYGGRVIGYRDKNTGKPVNVK